MGLGLDKNGEDAAPTTLVYTHNLCAVIDQVISAQGIGSPFINIGIDGGKDKVDKYRVFLIPVGKHAPNRA